jgi:hypothetical protein
MVSNKRNPKILYIMKKKSITWHDLVRCGNKNSYNNTGVLAILLHPTKNPCPVVLEVEKS